MLGRAIKSHRLVAGAGDNVKLLLTGEVDELYGITGNTNGKVRIFFLFGMFHSVNELLCTEDIYIKMVRALIEIAVHDLNKVVHPLVITVTESIGADGLGVGDTVKRSVMRKLCNGIERRQKSVLLGAVAGVCARSKRCA